MTVHVRGRAFWSPGYGSFEAFRAGEEDETLLRPSIDIVESRMKRATSLMTRMAVDCVTRAIHAAELPLEDTATLFGSEHGEIQIAVEQMVMMQDEGGRISPARFKNSVHNTAAGLFSIAAKNKGFTTAIAGGADTFAVTLLEGLALLEAGDAKHAVVVIADEPLPEPITYATTHAGLAIAFALSTEGPGPVIDFPVAKKGVAPPVPDAFAAHAGAAAYRLLVALEDGERGTIRLSPRWELELQ